LIFILGEDACLDLTEMKCRECGVRLTQFEYEEKNGRCVDCYNEQKVPTVNEKFSLLEWKKKTSLTRTNV
ncbi:MAG TPA: hypothetical protein VJ824_13990, partial [Bacillota bacterium]|nr:hypothetical protein [Bacillota bacterium]